MVSTIHLPKKLLSKLGCFAIITTLFFPALTVAEVYKWTDENGNTHYSDIKPNSTSSEKLKIKTSKTSKASQTKNVITEAQKLSDKKQKELQAQADKLNTDTQKRELEAQCEAMRSNLKTIEENSRVKISEGDQIRFLTPEEIEQKKQSFRQQLEANC